MSQNITHSLGPGRILWHYLSTEKWKSFLVGKPNGKKPLGRPRRIWRKVSDLILQREIRWEDFEWFNWLRIGAGGGILQMR
jgi:hypothetical protein